jgi:hypothetical protein
MEPPGGSRTEDKSWFSSLVARSGRFSGKPTEDDGQKRVFKVLGVRQGRRGRRIVNMVACGATQSTPEVRAVESTCQGIGGAFKVHQQTAHH